MAKKQGKIKSVKINQTMAFVGMQVISFKRISGIIIGKITEPISNEKSIFIESKVNGVGINIEFKDGSTSIIPIDDLQQLIFEYVEHDMINKGEIPECVPTHKVPLKWSQWEHALNKQEVNAKTLVTAEIFSYEPNFGKPNGLPVLMAKVIPSKHQFTKEELIAIKKFQNGDSPSVSEFIDEDTIIAGYGQLGIDFEYPLPRVYIKQIYGTTSWSEYMIDAKRKSRYVTEDLMIKAAKANLFEGGWKTDVSLKILKEFLDKNL